MALALVSFTIPKLAEATFRGVLAGTVRVPAALASAHIPDWVFGDVTGSKYTFTGGVLMKHQPNTLFII